MLAKINNIKEDPISKKKYLFLILYYTSNFKKKFKNNCFLTIKIYKYNKSL